MKIVALGGGSIVSKTKKLPETTPLDREIIRLSGKKNPRLLFIPTASDDSELYVENIRKQFGNRLSCEVDVLLLRGQKISIKEIEKRIMSADIIYVGGGNTLKMMNLWRKLGVDTVLQKAAQSNKVLCGLSAGAICWFEYGNSDSRKFKNPKADYIRVSALNFIPLFLCPHFDAEYDRQKSLKNMLRKHGIALALDNCAGIEIVDGEYKILSSKPKAGAYKCFWRKGKYYSEPLSLHKRLSPLNELLTREKAA